MPSTTWQNSVLVYNNGGIKKVGSEDVVELTGTGSTFSADILAAASSITIGGTPVVASGVSADTSGVTAGDVVYRTGTAGVVAASENDSLTAAALEVDGVALNSSATGSIQTVAGTTAYVAFVSAPSAAGQIVYLSGTAGQATVTLPTTGRVYRLGKTVSTTAVGGLYPVQWAPQYIVDL